MAMASETPHPNTLPATNQPCDSCNYWRKKYEYVFIIFPPSKISFLVLVHREALVCWQAAEQDRDLWERRWLSSNGPKSFSNLKRRKSRGQSPLVVVEAKELSRSGSKKMNSTTERSKLPKWNEVQIRAVIAAAHAQGAAENSNKKIHWGALMKDADFIKV